MRDSHNFKAMLKYGEEGEGLIARKLLRMGNVVQPLFQMSSNGAPRMLFEVSGRAASAVLPDLTCWNRAGKVYFVEVKRKRRWVNFHPRGPETGFNLSHLDDYTAIQARTKAPIVLTFIHEQQPPTGVFVGMLSRLATQVRRWDGLNCKTRARVGKPEAFFPRSALTMRWTLDELLP